MFNCILCNKELINTRRVQQAAAEVIDSRDGTTAIMMQPMGEEAVSSRTIQQLQEYYCHLRAQKIYYAQRNEIVDLYCLSCGSKLCGTIEYVDEIDKILTSDFRHSELDNSYAENISISSNISSDSEALLAHTITKLALPEIGVNIDNLLSRIDQRDDYALTFAEKADKARYPLLFTLLIEISVPLKQIFQIQSKEKISFYEAIDKLFKYENAFYLLAIKNARSNLRELEQKIGTDPILSHKANIFFQLIPNITEFELKELILDTDIATQHIAMLGDDFVNEHYQTIELAPDEFWSTLSSFQDYDRMLRDESGKKGYDLLHYALLQVCPELQRLNALAKSLGKSLKQYVMEKSTGPEISPAFVSVILQSARSFLYVLDVYAARAGTSVRQKSVILDQVRYLHREMVAAYICGDGVRVNTSIVHKSRNYFASKLTKRSVLAFFIVFALGLIIYFLYRYRQVFEHSSPTSPRPFSTHNSHGLLTSTPTPLPVSIVTTTSRTTTNTITSTAAAWCPDVSPHDACSQAVKDSITHSLQAASTRGIVLLRDFYHQCGVVGQTVSHLLQQWYSNNAEITKVLSNPVSTVAELSSAIQQYGQC